MVLPDPEIEYLVVKSNSYGLILKPVWPIPHSTTPPLLIKNHPKPSHVKPSAGRDVGYKRRSKSVISLIFERFH